MTIESFYDVYNDERVGEIVIVDDASDLDIYEDLKSMCDALPKVKLYRNLTNQDCYRNKMTAISYATNEWCILLDSDNKIDKSYLDRLFEINEWDENTSYMPSFAAPTFNYEDYSGKVFSKENVAAYMDLPLFTTMLNCMNLFINKNEYLRVWQEIENPHTADSIFFNYCWFVADNKMYVVHDLRYEHKIHSGSHYILNNHKTGNLYSVIEQKIKGLPRINFK